MRAKDLSNQIYISRAQAAGLQDLTYNAPLSVNPDPESICEEDECVLEWDDEEEQDKDFVVDFNLLFVNFEDEEIEDNGEI